LRRKILGRSKRCYEAAEFYPLAFWRKILLGFGSTFPASGLLQTLENQRDASSKPFLQKTLIFNNNLGFSAPPRSPQASSSRRASGTFSSYPKS
jgi:hypothetical protein